MNLSRLGSVTIDPLTPVVAGSTGQWTITLTVGAAAIDEGGTIKLCQRFASDWQPPQFDRPTEAGYTTITTNGEAKLRPRFDRKGHDRPWMQAIVIDVYDGSLAPGDVVTIVLGDKSKGSPGIRAQTFVETKHDLRVFVDPTNACVARAVLNQPTFPIVSGEPIRLVCIAGEDGSVFTKGEDRWGNPTPAPPEVKITRDGDFFVARSGNFVARSNPVAKGKYWGDLHAQSDATVGTGSEEEYFRFARDVARLDFCSHQANDFQVTDEDWRRLNEQARAFHEDGKFVVFPGWEWSGNTPAGGDRNVIYLDEDQPIYRSSHWQVPHIPETALSPAPTAADLFARVRAHRPDRTLLASHVGGRYADIRQRKYFDEELGPLVELVSCWGVFEWMLWDAFDMGYIVGVMCNSDGHKGRPGAEGPGAGQFGIANGLTCAIAESKTREAIFHALKNRRCYGTTGARIDVDFQIDDHPMGSIIEAGKNDARVVASVRGTAPIESLELFEGKRVIRTVRPRAFDHLTRSRRIRVSWRGSRIRGRGRRVNWDGVIRFEGGPRIESTAEFFDTPIDGITARSATEVSFISQTTGDTDGIDFRLDRADADHGVVTFDSKAGRCEVNLAELTDTFPRKIFPFGGLDMQVVIERYPESPAETAISLDHTISPPSSQTTPYFVKITQADGQMAWVSPIYIRRRS
jgi:hypothetical protein